MLLTCVFIGSLGLIAALVFVPDLSRQVRQALLTLIPEATDQPAASPARESTANPPQSTPRQVVQPTQAQAEPPASMPPSPDPDGMVILIRTALNALNHANRTNNYSILRETSSQGLQRANSGLRISEQFADLRERNVDLVAINVINPRLVRDPVVDDDGFLRMTGFFPSRPEQVNFDLIFQFEEGRWRLFGIATDTAPASVDAEAAPAPSPGPPVRSSSAVPQGTTEIKRKPEVPEAPTLVALARDAVTALNQANMTGNYAILRELGAPGFQQINTQKRLAQSFAELRGRKLDLGPIAAIEPRLFRPATIDERGMLRLTGFFPSRPEQVNFDLAFQMVGDEWRIFGIGVNTSRLVPAAQPMAWSIRTGDC